MPLDVDEAVEARLGTSWTSQDGTVLPVVSLNGQGDTPGDGSPFIAVEYPLSNERQFTVGNPGGNAFREEGAFRIVVNEVRGRGMARARGWLKELRALFRGAYFDGVQCDGASRPVVNDSNDLGNYFQFSFAVPYRFFATG